jgi:hypothetical protein
MSKTVPFRQPPATQNPEAWVKPPTQVLPPAPAAELVAMKRLTFELPETLHTRFKIQCVLRRRQAYEVVREIFEKAVTDLEAEHQS